MPLLCLLVLGLVIPFQATAASAIACHCFQNREFDEQNPAAADSYFLATTQNSLLALVYGLDKRDLVKAKMAGADGDLLWILNELANISEQPRQKVGNVYQKLGNWQSVMVRLGLDPESVGADFWAAGIDSGKLAAKIVDRILIRRMKADPKLIANARAAGIGNQELILAVLLKQDPVAVFSEIKQEKLSWGKLLADQGIANGMLINALLKERL